MACQNMMDIVRTEARQIGPGNGAPILLADEVTPVRVHRLEREPEMLYPGERAAMDVGDARRARVGIHAVGETLPQRQCSAAGLIARFQHRNALPGLPEQMRRTETSEPRPDDRYVACRTFRAFQIRQDIQSCAGRAELS